MAHDQSNPKSNQNRPNIVRRTPFPASVSQAVGTPLQPAVVYASPDASALDDQYEGRASGYTYAREGHPNADVLAAKIDALEAAPVPGIVLGSGMGAISAVYLGLLRAGDHIVAGDQLYGRSLRLLTQDLPRLGIECSFVDAGNADNVAAAMRPETKLVLVEVVSNPTLRIADLDGIAAVTADHNALLMVDNTFTTPRAVQAFDHGADIVIHSVTKLLAGHSDVTLGYVAVADPALRQPIVDAAVTWGFTPSPWDCWMAERGLHSFDLRFERAQRTAGLIAEQLGALSGVEAVIYPARTDHPDADRAAALLGDNPGNMVSFRISGGRTQADAFIRAAGEIPFAPTLGDIGTTLSHPASSSHRGLTEQGRAALGISEGFFRLSVGIEDPDLLIAELTAAVAAAKATL